MNTMNTIYKTLTEKYATSEALFDYLRSPEGGRLVVAMPEYTAAAPLAIIHYNKERTDMTVPHTKFFRSVVWNPLTNRPVCVSPARAAALDVEAAELPADATVENFVDGVMINMFYHGGAWRLATRTRLDADGSFYSSRTFADLFWETFTGAGLNVDQLDTRLSYSWVLQHPLERVVVAPQYGIPKLFLVEAYEVAEDGSVTIFSGPTALSERVRPAVRAHLVEQHDLRTTADVKARVEAWGRRFGAQWQGLVVKSAGGQRWKLRSAEYNAARMLRGNQANRAFHALELWSKSRREDYLRIYPEERADAEGVIERFKACTQELHDLYQKVYRRRELPLGTAPQKYRKLLWEAHQANAGAYFPALRRFMNGQDTARKLWLVNYERRYGAVEPQVLACGCESAKHDCVA